jgi:phosphotransferase system  glucose/maltose/N-acetylglucosamine-specific IIC component
MNPYFFWGMLVGMVFQYILTFTTIWVIRKYHLDQEPREQQKLDASPDH